MSSYSSPEYTLAYALEHLLIHYLSDVDWPLETLWDTTAVQDAVSALKSLGIDFTWERANNEQ